MKLTTTDTTRYGDYRAKIAAGTITPAEQKAFEALVRKMGQPEPRKKRKAKAAPDVKAAPTKAKAAKK